MLRAAIPPALLLTTVSVTNTLAASRRVQIDIYAVLGEAEYRAVLDVERRAGQKLDAVQATACGSSQAEELRMAPVGERANLIISPDWDAINGSREEWTKRWNREVER